MTKALTETQIDYLASYLGAWWTERLQGGEKASFRQVVEDSVKGQLWKNPSRPWVGLKVDYDPQGPLLEAVRAAGVDCAGFLFSAKGILPEKTTTHIYPALPADDEFGIPAKPARLEIKAGYGNFKDPIPLEELFKEAGIA